MLLLICFNAIIDLLQCYYLFASMLLFICFNAIIYVLQCYYLFASMLLFMCFNAIIYLLQCVGVTLLKLLEEGLFNLNPPSVPIWSRLPKISILF